MMKKKEQKSENSERWLLTYSDLITLLMILFVVLYAMSNVNETKYDNLSESLNSAMGSEGSGANSLLDKGTGILEGGMNPITDGEGTLNTDDVKSYEGVTINEDLSIEDFEKLKDLLYDTIDSGTFKDSLSVTIEEKGVVITLANDILFDSGKSEIREDMIKHLDSIVSFLKKVDNKIEIGGYTDNVPVHNILYKSNWQLSAQRAANVAQYLAEQYGIAPERLTAIGYGENNPVDTNDTEAGRAKNRRISITILFEN